MILKLNRKNVTCGVPLALSKFQSGLIFQKWHFYPKIMGGQKSRGLLKK